MKIASLFLISCLMLPPSVMGGEKKPPAKVDFAHDIVPILKARCAECHTNGKYKGSVSMDTREDLLKSKVVTPGKSATGELVKRITAKDIKERMPPKG